MIADVSLHAIRRFQERISAVSFAEARLELERILYVNDAGEGEIGRYLEAMFRNEPYRAVLDARGAIITVLSKDYFHRTKAQSRCKKRSKQIRKYGYRPRW